MIRLPPTSINISQQDLNFHLQQIDIYHGLLKQGFRKKEIIKYFDEQKAAQEAEGRCPPFINDGPGPSTLELALRARCSSEDTQQSAFEVTTDTKLAELSTTPQDNLEDIVTAPAESLYITEQSLDRLTKSTSVSKPADNDSIQNMNTRTANQDHAPRRSSLLRFTRTISSDPAEDEQYPTLSFSPRSNVTYRPRSQTYSYDQSEIDEEVIETCQQEYLSQDLEHLTLNDELIPTRKCLKVISPSSSSLSPEAPVFSPLKLPPPFSATPRVSPLAGLDLSSIQPVGLTNYPSTQSGVAGLSPDIPASGGGTTTTEYSNLDFASSPPLLPETERRHSSNSAHPTPPSLRSHPLTPPAPGSKRPRTQPRPNRARYLDGSFTVYDDSLPASVQPQTPADLARGYQVNEYDAAYTAPPGMIRSNSARRSQLGHHLHQASGEPSPTSRAMIIRQRRQREFARGARVEGLRIERLRQRATLDTFAGPSDRVTDFRRQRVLEMWRDDLDADGVGEENFDEAGLIEAFGIGMRVVSGNRRVT